MTRVDEVQSLLDRVEPLPDLALRLLQVVTDADTTTDDLLAALRTQPRLMIEVVRLSNSSVHDLPGEITEVSQTVAYLGASALVRMVVALCTSAHYARQNGASTGTAEAWRHGVATGIAAQIIAERKGTADPGCAFAAGLLHDIGELPLAPLVADRSAALDEAAEACRHGFVEAERAVLGIDHAALGALLAERWRLPSGLRSAIRQHHDLDLTAQKDELSAVVHVADVLTRQLGIGLGPGGLNYPVCDQALRRLHLESDEIDCIRLLVLRELKRSEDLLKLGAGGGR